jgi:hypothetical protein
MDIGLTLMAVGSLLAMSGAVASIVWMVTRPRRYARHTYRKGPPPAATSSLAPKIFGIALICAGAASFMSGVYWAT